MHDAAGRSKGIETPLHGASPSIVEGTWSERLEAAFANHHPHAAGREQESARDRPYHSRGSQDQPQSGPAGGRTKFKFPQRGHRLGGSKSPTPATGSTHRFPTLKSKGLRHSDGRHVHL